MIVVAMMIVTAKMMNVIVTSTNTKMVVAVDMSTKMKKIAVAVMTISMMKITNVNVKKMVARKTKSALKMELKNAKVKNNFKTQF